MKICSIEDCNSKYYGRGYCDKHYRRWRIHGDPLFTKTEMHGKTNSPEYCAWQDMKARCYNPKVQAYENYGGRGISVCGRWRNSFIAFYEDMGERPFPEATMDRINNDGNYEPSNCKWTTVKENNRHKRNIKLNMEKAKRIRKLYKTGKYTQTILGQLLGVSQGTIGFTIQNKIWAE